MANFSTRLADVIVPEQWTTPFLLADPSLTAFFDSGIVQRDDILAGFANGEGSVFHIRHLNDLGNDAENISSDDPNVFSTPLKVGMGEQKAIKLARNQSWSSMDLVGALVSPDPVSTIRSRVAAYWARRMQVLAIAELNGVLADNIANDGGDMRFNGSANPLSAAAILSAKITMGDAAEALNILILHSGAMLQLELADMIQYLRVSESPVTYPHYLGFRVIVDDGVPVDRTVPAVPVYTSILTATGELMLGMGQSKTPVEVERKAASGNGEGEEIFHTREQFILHPRGFSYTGAPTNPTNVDLAAATSWNRVFPRKSIPLAFLTSK